MIKDIHGRSSDDIFFGHVSHHIKMGEVFSSEKHLGECGKAELEKIGLKIDSLAAREETYHEEEALAVLQKRKPRHPGPIVDLEKYSQQFSRNQEAVDGGMTYTSFVTEKGIFISAGYVKSMDAELGDDDSDESYKLHDLVAAPEKQEIQPWREPEFCGSFEETLVLLSESVEEIAALFCVTDRHVRNLIRNNINNFQKVYRNCEDVNEKVREQMVASLHRDFKAALAVQNDKKKQCDLFAVEANEAEKEMGVA